MVHEAQWDHHTSWSMCPHCGELHDGAAAMTSDHPPTEGDVGICFECGGWTVFQADGSRRKPTPEEQAEIDADPRTQHTLEMYWKFRRMHPERWPT